MSTHKRPLSSESLDMQNAPSKRSATARVLDSDEDSLEDILAQIKAQEESEALARKLQDEWNAPVPCSRWQPTAGGSGSHNSSGPSDIIVISDDDAEDDQAMARRLAKEWDLEDSVLQSHPLASSRRPSPPKDKARHSSSDTSPAPLPTSDLAQYRELFVGERSCSCGFRMPSSRGLVMYTTQVPPPNLLRLLHVPCKSCNKNHCRACMSATACQPSCKGKPQNEACPINECCTDVRAIALFEALGGFDRQYLGERTMANDRAREAAAKARATHANITSHRGVGYGGNYAGDYLVDFNRYSSPGSVLGRSPYSVQHGGASQRDLSAAHFDEIIVRALNTITYYLPSPYSDNAQIYDMLPHPAISSLLLLSQIPDLLASLLRNDSVTDWIARIDVYQAMLALLRRMADCELTLGVLTGPRWEMTRSCGLEEWMWGDGEVVWERDPSSGELVPAPPLYAHFKKLTKQCETFLAGASGMLESAGDDEDAITMVKATSLCGDIIAVKEDIERAMVAMGKDPSVVLGMHPTSELADQSGAQNKGKGRDPSVEMERTYTRECERLAFQHVTLSRPSANGGLDYPEYMYSRELAQTAQATRNPKDRLHLIKELAMMATSLPPGVWMRVDEVRNDAIKIMIAGPEGTPYAGGLFEFDCFIPLAYPNCPPLMYLRTTGGGSVRFNPNLYNNGKVCLSLLGTWQGRPEEQWSRKSTLLQVVVSIQSMILVDHPYFNEPGYGQPSPHNQASIEYNENIMLQTTRWAIVDWLQDKHKGGLWADVIASHFLTRHEKIEKCIQKWAGTVPSIRKCATGRPNSVYMTDHAGSLVPPPEYLDSMMDMGGWGTSVYSGSGSTLPTRGGHSGRKRQLAASPTVNLVSEFQEGIKRVRAWRLTKTGE
ncbi:hypothetical protein C2E23DRAFT_840286 [Lenzites betulinus]|nr:hypothetical protein C2E23DRAFT_840286 [Lenzites betulinus]